MHNYHMHCIGDISTQDLLSKLLVSLTEQHIRSPFLSTPESTANGGRLRAISSARL